MTPETLKVYRIKGTNQAPTHPFATLIISHGETTPGNQLTQEDSIENALHSLFPGEWLHINHETHEIHAGTPDTDNYEPLATFETEKDNS